MKKTLFFFFCLPCLLMASENICDICAETVTFDGNSLFLDGQIELDHKLGKIFADKAIFECLTLDKKNPFSKITLSSRVDFLLQSGASLKSRLAVFDPAESKLFFDGGSGKIELRDVIDKKNPLFLTAKCAACNLNMPETFKGLSLEQVLEITFEKDILVTYLNNELHADTGSLDLHSYDVKLQHASGFLASLTKDSDERVNFIADTLSWEQIGNCLTLGGNVIISKDGFGSIESDKATVWGKKTLKKIMLTGNCRLNFIDKTQKKCSTITCPGQVIMDNEKKEIYTCAEEKILFKDEALSVLANKAEVSYQIQNGTLQPVGIILQGEVKLISKTNFGSTSYGFCDKIAYSPADKNLILYADENKKVLFWQDDNSLSICSDEIRITRDKAAKSQEVQSIGNARFVFNFEEENFIHEFIDQFVGQK